MTTSTELSNADQITYWNEIAGAKWVANQARLDRVFAPLTQALIAAAAPEAGDHILDVGCGCGETSLLSAVRIGPTGQILAVDISQPMLDHARSRVDAAVAPITWLQADAMTHGFAATADLMISRFGVMFFADQLAAFANLRRALKPGGRFALLCWQPRPDVVWMQWPLEQVASVLPTPEPTTGQVGPFGLADADATCRMLRDAGFSQVKASAVATTLTIGIGPDPVEDAMALLGDAGPVAALFRDGEPAERAKGEAMLRAALAGRIDAGAIRLDAACWLYEGTA
ncbi:class I SAM-dependent methyltransferase [Beijerinckia sp. L45]|uniref:class I SAM-dependent methyltransferase n=1 Tax=Beijerinckia sp. L45 TaxID=1641855 RepID=UPI00131DCD55|nr:class I SAM-dependent methyltransferase [Beijerinckia sp. L45]